MLIKRLLLFILAVGFLLWLIVLCLDPVPAAAYRYAHKDSCYYPDSLDNWAAHGDSDLVSGVDRWHVTDINSLRDGIEKIMRFLGFWDLDSTVALDTLYGREFVPLVTRVANITAPTSTDTATYADTAWFIYADSIYGKIDSSMYSDTAAYCTGSISSATTADTAAYGDDPIFTVVDSFLVSGWAVFDSNIVGSKSGDGTIGYMGLYSNPPYVLDTLDDETYLHVDGILYCDSIISDAFMTRTSSPGVAFGDSVLRVGNVRVTPQGLVGDSTHYVILGACTLGVNDTQTQFELSKKVTFPGGHLGDEDSTLSLRLTGDDIRGIFVYIEGENPAGISLAPRVDGGTHAYGIQTDVNVEDTMTGSIYGVYSDVDFTGSFGKPEPSKMYSGYFVAKDGTTAVGIYAEAQSAANMWAGWFHDNIFVGSSLSQAANRDIYCDSLFGVADTALHVKSGAGVDSATISDTSLVTKDTRVDSCGNADTAAVCTGTIDSATTAYTALAVDGDSVSYADTSDYATYSGWSYDGAACDTADFAHAGDSVNFAINADTAGWIAVKIDSSIYADTASFVTSTVDSAVRADTATYCDTALAVAVKVDSAVVADTALVATDSTLYSDSSAYADHAGEADSASGGVFLASDSIKVGAYTVLFDSNLVVDSITANYVSAGVTSDSVQFADTSDYAKDADASAWTWDDGLTETNNEIDIQLAALSPGLEFSSNRLRVDVDDTTIYRRSCGLTVKQNIYDRIGDANTTLDESNGNPDCGAALIGADNTEFGYSSGTNVQDVLDDLDAQIAAYSDSVADFEVTGELTADSLVSNITMTNDLVIEGTLETDTLVGDVTVTGELTADSLAGAVTMTGDVSIEGTVDMDTVLSDLYVGDDLVVGSTIDVDTVLNSVLIIDDLNVDSINASEGIVAEHFWGRADSASYAYANGDDDWDVTDTLSVAEIVCSGNIYSSGGSAAYFDYDVTIDGADLTVDSIQASEGIVAEHFWGRADSATYAYAAGTCDSATYADTSVYAVDADTAVWACSTDTWTASDTKVDTNDSQVYYDEIFLAATKALSATWNHGDSTAGLWSPRDTFYVEDIQLSYVRDNAGAWRSTVYFDVTAVASYYDSSGAYAYVCWDTVAVNQTITPTNDVWLRVVENAGTAYYLLHGLYLRGYYVNPSW